MIIMSSFSGKGENKVNYTGIQNSNNKGQKHHFMLF